MTKKIKVNTITINNNVNRTDRREKTNRTYIYNLRYKMKHLFSNFRQYALIM